MSSLIIRILTPGRNFLYFTGRGNDWVSEEVKDACELSEAAGARKLEELRREYAGIGLFFELIAKPGDLYFSLIDNCGDEVIGRGCRGGMNSAQRLEMVKALAAKAGRSFGQGRVVIRDAKSRAIYEVLELPMTSDNAYQ